MYDLKRENEQMHVMINNMQVSAAFQSESAPMPLGDWSKHQ
jgi:hypothetical protein